MGNDLKILNLMVGHHALIEAYLSVVKNNLNKKAEDIIPVFENFKWQLEKHFFIEERSIFNSYEITNAQAVSLIGRVAEEHKEILGITVRIHDSLLKGEAVSVFDLQEILSNHRVLEEKELYPLLDKEFTSFQKEAIIKKINDIVLQSSY